MQEIVIDLSFKTLPPIVTRNRHALILVRTQDGKFVLGSKKHYPEKMSRLVGGGVDEGEDPQLAAARELHEELQIEVPAADLKPLSKVTARIRHEGETIEFVTWLYFYQLKFEKVVASSDLDNLVYLTSSEYFELIRHFSHLPTELHPILGFSWSDYGQLYGPIHQIAIDEYLNLATDTPTT